MLPAPSSAKGSNAVSATVSSTPPTHHVEGGIVVAPPAAPGPATATSSAATAPLAVITPGDKEQQQPTLQQRIDRVKGLRQTMLDACKDMLLAVQRAHEVFKWKYAGPKAEPMFVPCSAFEDLKLWELLGIDAPNKVTNLAATRTPTHARALSYIQPGLVFVSSVRHLQEEHKAVSTVHGAYSVYSEAVERVVEAVSRLSSAAKLQSSTYTDSQRTEAQDILDACQPVIVDADYCSSFAGCGL